jgi:hypothetical protein
MSKRISDNLHQLIISLTKSEKRYFKIDNSNSKQILLFDVIDKLKDYDSTLLIKKVKDASITNQLALNKSRLYASVLKSLRAFHSNNTIDSQLINMYLNAELLFNKTLYKQSKKILTQAKKIADKHEKHNILILLSKLEKKLFEKNNYSGVDTERIEDIINSDKSLGLSILNHVEFWGLKSLLFSHMYKQGQARTKAEQEEFNGIIKHPLLKDYKNATTTESKYLYNHIYSAYHFSSNQFSESYDYLMKNVNLIEDNPAIFKEEPNTLFAILTNVIFIGNQLKKYDEVEILLAKLNALVTKLEKTANDDLKLKLFGSIYSLEIHMYVQKAEFEKAYALIPKIVFGIQKYGNKVPPIRLADFYYSMTAVCIALQKYSEALQYINQLFSSVKIAETEDLYAFAQLIKIMIHYELEHTDLLPYITQSTYRCLKKNEKFYKSEKLILTTYKSVLNNPTEETELFKKLVTDLKAENEEVMLNHFDFISFFESKITGDSMDETLNVKRQ